jgi:hypothetical protein
LTVDANFRLKVKDKQIKNDPPLGAGWGHWVPDAEYHSHLERYGGQDEVRFVGLFPFVYLTMFRSPTSVTLTCALLIMRTSSSRKV